jgi:SAM-dependent methyltransferase
MSLQALRQTPVPLPSPRPHRSPCWLCASADTVDVYEIAWEREVPVVACRDCGFVFQGAPPGEAEQRAYYQRSDVFHEHGPESRLGRLVARRHAFLRDQLGAWLDQPTSRTLLDVGCGYGDFLGAFDGRRWRRIGLEWNPRRARHARSAFGVTVHEETLSEWSERGTRVDLCTAFGLVEHVTDPRGLLEAARQVLDPDGYLIANVPDMADPLVAISDFFCIEHCAYYDERSFRSLLASSGFEVLATTRLTADYPDVAVLARPAKARPAPVAFRDREAARGVIDGVRGYIRRRAALVGSIRRRLEDAGVLARPQRVALYGAGVHTRLLVQAVPELRDATVFFDSDRDRWGEPFLDGVIHPVDRAAELGIDSIVISSRAFEDEIARSLSGRLPPSIRVWRLYS